MKNLTRKTSFLIAAWVALCMPLLLSGCMGERNHLRRGGKDGEITLILRAPAMDVDNNMRQMSAHQESAVKNLKILVFKTKDAGATLSDQQEKYAYEAKISSVTPQDGGKYYKVVARLKGDDNTTPYRLVLIANHSFDADALAEGMSKAEVFAASGLKKAFTEKWDTNDAAATIPMWGESDAKVITEGVTFSDCFDQTGEGKTKIHLIRSLARVDVGISFNGDVASEETTPTTDVPLTLESVRVYRYATSFLVPGTQTNTYYSDNGVRKPKPVLPDGVAMAEDTKCLSFTAINDRTSVRDIYIPERLKGSDKSDRPCLVIGGKYNGAAKATYYRLDFIKTPKEGHPKDTAEALDILRNHRYRFNITKVSGPGYDTPEEALSGEPVNIYFDVVVWDEAQVGEVRYDGQYYLAVNKDKFEFGKDESNDAFTVRTNWEGGYKFVDAEGNELPKTKEEAVAKGMWYYLSDPKDPAFAKDQDFREKVFVLENTTGDARTAAKGSIFVQAGRIKWPLNIKQSDKVELDIKIYLSETGNWRTDCEKDPISGHTCMVDSVYRFWVKYTPNSKLGRIPLDRDEQFTWNRVSDDPDNGIALYEVVMHKEDFPENDLWASEITKFRVVKGDANVENDFTLKVMRWDAIPYKDGAFKHNMLKEEPVYTLGDFYQRFFIRANAPYTLTVGEIDIESISGEPTQSQVVKTWVKGKLVQEISQPAYAEGELVRFLTYDHIGHKDQAELGENKIVSAVVELIVSPKAKSNEPGFFPAHKFKIHFVAGILQPEANTYVVEAGQIPILIPCSQLNKAADWWNSNADEMQEIFKRRLKTAAHEQGISYGVYKNYVNELAETPAKAAQYIRDTLAVPLPRLEPSDRNWSAHCVWSTLEPTGANSGLERVEGVHIKLGGQNYILVQPKPEYEGCAVVSAVRNYATSNSRILWNWTIWVVKKKRNHGQGYPWDDNDNGTHGKPYMNRNLGAYRMASEGTRTSCYDKFDNDMTGLYYKHGTPVPHHAYEEDGKRANTGTPHCSKVWYNTILVPEGYAMQNRMGKKGGVNPGQLYDMAAGKDMCSMHDIIRFPTEMYARNKVSEYILELGTTEWGAYLMKKMWQGGDAPGCLNNEMSFNNFAARTQKTPFDPSPYGWKVPAAGAESRGLCQHPNLTFSKTGGFLAGWYYYMRIGSEGNCVVLHVATRAANADKLIFNYFLFSSGRWTHTDTGGDVGGGNSKTYPSTHYPIRCIENEAESDYLDYTQDAVMSNARNATRALRTYYR